MKTNSATYQRMRKWLLGCLTPAFAVCLAVGLFIYFPTTSGVQTYAADATFNNIVNTNIGLHPQWEMSQPETYIQGGVGDNYTGKHNVWHVKVKDAAHGDNDPVLEQSPSYVFQGTEENASELIERYSLKKGNEVVFNVTEGMSPAKVWADAVAFAQSIGEVGEVADTSLLACNSAGGWGEDEYHYGFRVGSNTGVRNQYQGNFFIENENGALGQYITVRLHTDWVAKNITASAPTTATTTQLNPAALNNNYVTVNGSKTGAIKTTSFNYISNTENDSVHYLPDSDSSNGFTRIDTNDNDNVIAYDLSSNSADYDYDDTNKTYHGIFNENCAFSFGRIQVPTGVYIVLDLNGHTIDRNLTGGSDRYGQVFHISSKARLEICDTSAYENASSLRIEGDAGDYTTNHKGTIKGGNAGGSSFGLPAGLLVSLQQNGGGFNLSMWADLVVHSGTIRNNKSSSTGGAIYERSKSSATIYDGYILDNTAGTSGGVTSLGAGSGCSFCMYGGVLAYNKANNGNGGAVYLGVSSFGNFHGGEIVHNTATQAGGALYVNGNTLGILDSVTIKDNHAGTHGGAVFVNHTVAAVDRYLRSPDMGTAFKFRGSLQIYNNTAGSSSKTENVYLEYGTTAKDWDVSGTGQAGMKLNLLVQNATETTAFPKIGIGGSMFVNGIVARVGVTIGTSNGDRVFTSDYAKAHGDAGSNQGVNTYVYFFSDDIGHSVVNDGSGANMEGKLGNSVASNGTLTWVVVGKGIYNGTEEDIRIEAGDSTTRLYNEREGGISYTYEGLTCEFRMLRVTSVEAHVGGASGTLIGQWAISDDSLTNSFTKAQFRFKLGLDDVENSGGSADNVLHAGDNMYDIIHATDDSISYAGEYSFLVANSGTRYTNPNFKIKINQVGVEVDRQLYYNGTDVIKLGWQKDINWDNSKNSLTGEDTFDESEKNQPYFIYTGGFYYPILSADYNNDEVQMLSLYNPFDDKTNIVAKKDFTGYVLDFTYANGKYFGYQSNGKGVDVDFGAHSGGGIEYRTMHRQPGQVEGVGTYVPGVMHAGTYSVSFVSSRTAASADAASDDALITGVYFAANNFAFSSAVNIYVAPAGAEVQLTESARNNFTYRGTVYSDREIIDFDNTSDTAVNPHTDTAARMVYYLFDKLQYKAGIYDERTGLYYTLDQIADWANNRPFGSDEGGEGNNSAPKHEEGATSPETRPVKDLISDKRPKLTDLTYNQIKEAPVVRYDAGGIFDTADKRFQGVLGDNLAAFEAEYAKPRAMESTGRLCYIIDAKSFTDDTYGQPTDARRYVVLVTLDLDVGYDDYDYEFDQDAEHLVGIDGKSDYFWAFEFTVDPAEIDPYETGSDGNTQVSLTKDVWYNGDSYGWKYDATSKTFDSKVKSDQANIPTINFTGTSTLALEEGKDFSVDYISFKADADGESTFNYLDASVKLDPNGETFGAYKFGAHNLAVKIIFGGENKNFVNHAENPGSADEKGTAYEDESGAFYIYFRIAPIVVTATGSLSYTYDGSGHDRARYLPPRDGKDDDDAWYESIFFLVQDSITTPADLILHQHEKEYSTSYEGAPEGKRSLDDLWGGTEDRTENDVVVHYGDTSFYKGRYTLGNMAVSYSDESFKSHPNVQFGLGLYSFKTEKADASVTPYHLTTVDYDGQRNGSNGGVDTAPKETGVTWLLTTLVNGSAPKQSFNVAPNFVVDENSSWLDVTINKKDISSDFGSVTKFGDQTFDHVSAGTGSPITGEATGVEYPYAGSDWGYFPLVGFDYVPSFTDGADKTQYYSFGKRFTNGNTSFDKAELKATLAGKSEEGFDLTLSYNGNSAVSSANGAIVRVTGVGNYTGSFRLTFTIRAAKIDVKFNEATKGDVIYDMSPHAADLLYTNKEVYDGYLSDENGIKLDEAGTTYNGHLLQNIVERPDEAFVKPAPAAEGNPTPVISYRSSHDKYGELVDGLDTWTEKQPIDAKVYRIRVSTTSKNFTFVDNDEFKHDPPHDETRSDTIVYGTYTILPATVSVKVTPARVTYNGDPQSATVQFTNAREGNSYIIPRTEGEDYSIKNYSLTGTYTYNSAEAPTDAGSYTVTVALTQTPLGNSYYCNFAFKFEGDEAVYETSEGLVFEIAQATVSVEHTDSVQFNRSAQSSSVTFANHMAGNDAVPVNEGENYQYGVMYAATDGAQLASGVGGGAIPYYAGKYTVTVVLLNSGARNFTFSRHAAEDLELKEDDRLITALAEYRAGADGKTELYIPTYAPGALTVPQAEVYVDEFEIERLNVSITQENTGNVYDKTGHFEDAAKFTFAPASTVSMEKVGYTLTVAKAGATLLEAQYGGYTIFDSTGTATGDPTAAVNRILKYRDEAGTLKETPQTVDDIVAWVKEHLAHLVENAGAYTLTIAFADANFNIENSTATDNDTKINFTYTITPATLTLNLVDPNKSIGNLALRDMQIDYDGREHKAEVQFSSDTVIPEKGIEDSSVTGDNEYCYSYAYVGWNSGETDCRDVGMYTVTVLLKESGNYSFGPRGSSYIYRSVQSYSIVAYQLEKDNIVFYDFDGMGDNDHLTTLESGVAKQYGFDGETNNIVGLDKEGNVVDIVYTGAMIEPIQGLYIPEGSRYLNADEEYTIAYSDRINAKKVTVTVAGLHNFAGNLQFTFTIKPKSLGTSNGVDNAGTYDPALNDKEIALTSEASFANLVYRGTAHHPAFILTYNAVTDRVKESTTPYAVTAMYDYTLETYRYVNGKYEKFDDFENKGVINAGTYYLVATGQNNFTGVFVHSFEVKQAEVTAVAQTASFTYDDTAHLSGVVFTGIDASSAIPSETRYNFVFAYTDGDTYTYEYKEGGATLYTLTFDSSAAGYMALNGGTFENGDGFKNAGQYTVTVKFTAAEGEISNYTFADGKDSATYAYDVDPALISVVSFGSAVYDGEQHGIVLGENTFQATTGFSKSGPELFALIQENYNDSATEYKLESATFKGGEKPVNAGTYSVTFKLNEGGNFAFGLSEEVYQYTETSQTFTITQRDLATVEHIEVTADNVTFTGSQLTPTVKVKVRILASGSDLELAEDSDYTCTYSNNVNAGEATVTILGMGNYMGTNEGHFTISPKSLGTSSAEGSYATANNDSEVESTATIRFTYNEKPHMPTPSLRYTAASDGTVNYLTVSDYDALKAFAFKDGSYDTANDVIDSIIEAGKYLLVVPGTGNYTGNYVIEIQVLPAGIIAEAETLSFSFNNGTQLSGVKFVSDDDSSSKIPPTPDFSKAFADFATQYKDGTYIYKYEEGGKVIFILTFKDNKIDMVDGTTLGYFGSFDSGEGFKNAGIYTVDVTFPEDGDYKFAGEVLSMQYSFVITPAIISISEFENATFNNQEQGVTIDENTFHLLETGSFTVSQAELLALIEANHTSTTYYGAGDKPLGDGVLPKNAGRYSVTYALQWGGNFAFGTQSGRETTYSYSSSTNTFTIEAFDLSTLDDDAVKVAACTYTGLTLTPDVTVTAPFEPAYELIVNDDFMCTFLDNVNATEKAQAVLVGKGNFTGSKTVNFVISPKNIGSGEELSDEEIKATYSDSSVYNATEYIPNLVVTYNPAGLEGHTNTLILNAESGDYTVSYSTEAGVPVEGVPTNAGKYYIVVKANEGGNYAGSFKLLFTIEQAELTVQLNGAYTYMYNGSAYEPTLVVYSSTSAVPKSPDDYTISDLAYLSDLGEASESNGHRNAGTYTYTITLGESGNFKFASAEGMTRGEDGSVTISYRILPARLNVSLSASSASYNGMGHDLKDLLTFSNLDGVVTPVNSDYEADKAFEIAYKISGKGALEEGTSYPLTVGSYTVTVTLPTGGNFIFATDGLDASKPETYNPETYVLTSELAYTIVPMKITASLDALSFVYNGVDQRPNIVFDATAGAEIKIEENEDYTLVYTYSATNTEFSSTEASLNAGHYRVTITLKTRDGYDAPFFTFEGASPSAWTGNYEINKAKVHIELTTASEVYNGEAHKPENYLTFSNLDGNETIIPGGESNPNKANDSYSVTYSFGSSVTGEIVNAGDYTVRVTLGDNFISDNISTDFAFTVTPQIVSVNLYEVGSTETLASTSRSYDGARHNMYELFSVLFKDTVGGDPKDFTKLGDEENDKIRSLRVTYNSRPISLENGFYNPGTYVITVTLADRGNFAFGATSGYIYELTLNFMIDPLDISGTDSHIDLEIGDVVYYYTGSLVTLEEGHYTVRLVYGEEGKEPLVLTPDQYTLSYANNIEAGTVTVTVHGQGAIMGQDNATFEIVPKPIGTKEGEGDSWAIAKEFAIGGIGNPLAAAEAFVFYYSGDAVTLNPSITYDPSSIKAGLSKFVLQTSTYTLLWKAVDDEEWTKVSDSLPKDAGEYILRVDSQDTGNYSGKFDTAFRILPAHIMALLGTDSGVFTGKGLEAPIELFFSLQGGGRGAGIALEKGVDYTVSYVTVLAENTMPSLTEEGLPLTVGTYGVTVSLTSACKNYVFKYGTDGLPAPAEEQKYSELSYKVTPAFVMPNLSQPSAIYTGSGIDCNDFITLTSAYAENSDSEVWKDALKRFTVSYTVRSTISGSLDAKGLPLTVGEYTLVIKLDDDNKDIRFLSNIDPTGAVDTSLSFTITRALLTPSADGSLAQWGADAAKPVDGQEFDMEGGPIVYDPEHDLELAIEQAAFALLRAEDIVSLKFSVTVTDPKKGEDPFNYTDDGVRFLKSGVYTVKIEATSANYETAVFTINVTLNAQDIIITTEGAFSTVYGTAYTDRSDELLAAFLDIVKSVSGIPGDVTELEAQKQWLTKWGLEVTVNRRASSTAGKLKVGDYCLGITLTGADNKVIFAEPSEGDDAISATALYNVTPMDVHFAWELDSETQYNAKNRFDEYNYQITDGASRNGVFHTEVFAKDEVFFEGYAIYHYTGLEKDYTDETTAWESVDGTLRNAGRYKIELVGPLGGADSKNYAFGGNEKFFFRLTRMEVTINVNDVHIRYGMDFKAALGFFFIEQRAFEAALRSETGTGYNIESVEDFLRGLLVVQNKDPEKADIYGAGMFPPVGEYDIKFGYHDESGWHTIESTVWEDEETYINYKFILEGQYGYEKYGSLFVSSLTATISLKFPDEALAVTYGEYKYMMAETDGRRDLTEVIFNYIFGNIGDADPNKRRVSAISGLDEAYPDYSWEQLTELLMMNCSFEVVEPTFSTGGLLNAGTYGIKVVTKEGSPFTVSFAKDYEGMMGPGGAYRLVVKPFGLDVVFGTTTDEIEVDEEGGLITAVYTTHAYDNAPYFDNVFAGDKVGAPTFHFTDVEGNRIDAPKNVGKYKLVVDDLAVGADNKNYALPATLTIGLEITPRKLTVSVHDMTGANGSIYGDAIKSLGYDVDWDWENRADTSDDLNIRLTREGGLAAGRYSIKGIWDNGNYSLDFTEAFYDIAQRKITVQIDDQTSYYGDEFKALTYRLVGGSFAQGENEQTLNIPTLFTGGPDVGIYPITGTDEDPNYEITVLPGKYTILQATNQWLTEFAFGGWAEGQKPKSPELPDVKFGAVETSYFYDEECTEAIEDLSALMEGEYFIKLKVAETANYTGLEMTYKFGIEHTIDATLYVILFSSQFLILTLALIFIRERRKKNKERPEEQDAPPQDQQVQQDPQDQPGPQGQQLQTEQGQVPNQE